MDQRGGERRQMDRRAGEVGPAGLPSTLIVGLRNDDGSSFRPSDWADRLVGVLDVFGDASCRLGDWARCEQVGGSACVRVSERLRSENVHAWGFMMGFAADNSLRVLKEPWPLDVPRPGRAER